MLNYKVTVVYPCPRVLEIQAEDEDQAMFLVIMKHDLRPSEVGEVIMLCLYCEEECEDYFADGLCSDHCRDGAFHQYRIARDLRILAEKVAVCKSRSVRSAMVAEAQRAVEDEDARLEAEIERDLKASSSVAKDLRRALAHEEKKSVSKSD